MRGKTLLNLFATVLDIRCIVKGGLNEQYLRANELRFSYYITRGFLNNHIECFILKTTYK